MAGTFSLAQCAADYVIQKRVIGIAAASPTKIAALDSTRVFLSFSDNTGNAYLGNASVVGQQGYLWLSAQVPVITMTWAEWGPLVQEDWYAIRTSGISNMGVLEVFYRPSGGLHLNPQGL